MTRAGQQNDDGPERAPDRSCGWAGPGRSRGPRREAHGQAAAPSILKGPPRRQRPQAVLRS